MDSSPCGSCGNDVPLEVEHCPHCGRAGEVPNVKAARLETETRALDQRYQVALQDATAGGCSDLVESFETAAGASKAVINRPLLEVERLASSDRQLYASFYQRLEAGLQLPYGEKWDRLRVMADMALFPNHAKPIRFAALSLDGIGLRSYGECTFVLREDLIAHRTSVFEDNSAMFLRELKLHDKVPPGHRASWAERSKLCVAKLASRIHAAMTPADFPGLLLEQGATPEDDRFVEVHIWGPLSIRSFERVILSTGSRPPRQVIRKALRTRMNEMGLELEYR